MTTDLIARIEKAEAAARSLLAAGFTTKAAQKAAREACTEAFAGVRRQLHTVYLAMPREGQDTEGASALYYGIDYPHIYKAKHSDAIRKHIPGGAHLISDFERLAALSAEIKAAPITVKLPTRLNDAELPVLRSDAFNPELRAEFMKQAPALTAEWIAGTRSSYERMVARFDGVVPLSHPSLDWSRDRTEQARRTAIRKEIARLSMVCDRVGDTLVLNEDTLAATGKRYGELVALQWFYKTNLKLGELSGAKLHEDRGGYVVVSGEKADGAKVVMKQQRVTKWAPVACELFHQFPARLYVDGKFTEERAYVKRFGA